MSSSIQGLAVGYELLDASAFERWQQQQEAQAAAPLILGTLGVDKFVGCVNLPPDLAAETAVERAVVTQSRCVRVERHFPRAARDF